MPYTPARYPWTRRWRALEKPLRTDADGFLALTEGAELPSTLDAIDAPCVLLLGESGVGKSMTVVDEVRRLRDAKEQPEFFDLGGRGDEKQLRGDLRAALAVGGEGLIHLFFDSLDEAPHELARFDALLAEELERAYRALARVRLRIACRTGALLPRLVDALERVWGKGKVAQYEIAPLTREDAVLALAKGGLTDPAATLDRWCAARLGPLATRPVTLQLLLDVAKESGHDLTAMGVTELYRRALSLMLRRSDAHRHRAALRRLAAATLLGEKNCLRPHDQGTARDAWTIDDLRGGEEPLDDGGSTAIDDALLRDVWRGPLFAALDGTRDAERLTWRHRSFAEFLCAEWLAKRHPGAAGLRWLEREVAGERRVVPQLEGVAVWLANLDDGARETLIVDAPNLLRRLDATHLAAAERERVVEAFLQHLNGPASPAWWWLRGTHLAAFEHPGFDAQLRAWIADTSRRKGARIVAVWSAEEGRREAVLPALFEVALSPHDDDVRKQVVAAIVSLLPERDERLRQLLPLLVEHPPDDPGEDLRGDVLRACWPWCFAGTEAAFAVLNARRDETVHGVYASFLDYDLPKLLPRAWLPDALAWARKSLASRDWRYHDVRKELVRRAWERVDEPAVQRELVALRVAVVREHEDFALPEALRVAQRAATRSALVEQTIRESVENDLRWTIDARVSAWLMPADFHLLVARADAAEEPEVSERLLELALRLHEAADRPGDQTEKLEALAGDPRFSKRVQRLWHAWELDDPDLQWVRPGKRPAPAVRPPEGSITEGQRQRILSELARAENEDTECWWQLHAWACARPVSEEACEFTLDFRVEDTPFWKTSDEAVRQRVCEAALRYVATCPPHTDEWFGKELWHRPALAGRAALVLLQQFAPDRLARLPAKRWATWTPALLDPTWMTADEHGGVWPLIVREAHRHTPDEVQRRVLFLVGVENQRGEHAFVLGALGSIDDPSLAGALLDGLCLGGARPNVFRSALDVVGRSLPEDAAAFCRRFIGARWEAGGTDARCAALAAAWLLRERPDTAWETLAGPFHAVPALGGEAIESVARGKAFQWFPELTAPAHLAGYYRWAKRYLREFARPVRNHVEEADRITAPHYIHYSISPTIVRQRELGTPEAVAALEGLVAEEPDNEFLRGECFLARQAAAENAWRPWSLDALFRDGISRDLRRRLREALAACYPKEVPARILCEDAGLPMDRIDWQGSAQERWKHVLDVAIPSGLLEALLTCGAEEYPALAPLLAEVRAPRPL